MSVICPVCSTELKETTYNQRFCSEKCRVFFHNGFIMKEKDVPDVEDSRRDSVKETLRKELQLYNSSVSRKSYEYYSDSLEEQKIISREDIKKQTEEFLKNGGRIEEVRPNNEANQFIANGAMPPRKAGMIIGDERSEFLESFESMQIGGNKWK